MCGRYEGTSLEFIPAVGRFKPEHIDLITRMSAAAQRTLNWNLIAPSTSPQQMAVMDNNLGAYEYAQARGGRIIALTVPCAIESRLNFETGFVLDALNGWREPMSLTVDEKIALLSDLGRRRELDELAQGPSPVRGVAKWHKLTVGDVFSAENEAYVGRTIGDIAEEQGRATFDVLCDIVIADRLRTGLLQPTRGDDDETWALRVQVWRDERTLLGGTDAGAHLDLLATFNATSAMLGNAVRQRNLISWEEAVHHLTDAPAQLYGIKERGRLQEGYHADINVIDPNTVGARPTYAKYDLPGGAWRLYGEADGFEHVLVNGTEIVRNGEFTPARPGTLLRSGRDTVGTGV
ncbi:MAG: amidohydrolase family protein [Acidimicrobiales bacterium]